MTPSKNALGIALLVSAALNVLVIGAVGGMAIASLRHEPVPLRQHAAAPPETSFRFSPISFLRALPAAQRHKARRMMRSAGTRHKTLVRNIRRTRLEIFHLLITEPMDEAAIAKAFARLRALDGDEQALAQTMMVKILRGLDSQTRRRVIRAASHRPPEGPRPRRPQHRKQSRQ